MKRILAAACAVALGACASYEGRGLVPGRSSAAEVEAAMGRPAERIVDSAGAEVWFYPRAPEGRDTYAVRLDGNGVLAAIDQRLTKENIARVIPGKTTAREARALLGPPYAANRLALRGLDEWDYRMLVDNRLHDFLLEISDDGIVRKAYLLHDPIYDTPTPP